MFRGKRSTKKSAAGPPKKLPAPFKTLQRPFCMLAKSQTFKKTLSVGTKSAKISRPKYPK